MFKGAAINRVSTHADKHEVDVDLVRRRRIQEDATRPMSVNLAETIALSRQLAKIVGAARRA